MTESSKFPILLAAKCPLTTLIVMHAHLKTLHSGVNVVLSYIREKWWILKGRQTVKRVIGKCVKCLKVIGRPYTLPEDPPLPEDRITECIAFQVTGVDFTGSLNVKSNGTVIKAYIVLFTCAVSRAVHLEVVYDLSEHEFLRALVRFSSRRSFPQVMYSDNASNFVAAAKTLQSVASSRVITNFLLENRITWRFITPRAAWHGGMWERLIGLTKVTLKKVIGRSLLSVSDLETLVVQIECRLNDRPITYVSSDINDPQPLTPSHLISGHRLTQFPNLVDEDCMLDPTFGDENHIGRLFRLRTKVLQSFWDRWKHEYLCSLRERSGTHRPNNMKIPSVGEVVLLVDDKPRMTWRLAVVQNLLSSDDKSVRSVEVRTTSGNLVRPVSKLCPLELRFEEEVILKPNTSLSRDRPARASAIKAREKIGSM